MIHFLEIQQQVLDPQCRPLADRGGLRGLEVRVSKRREVPVLLRECGKRADAGQQPLTHQQQRIAVLQQLAVVRDVCAGGAQVDDAVRLGRDIAVVMNMGHHVVTETLLVRGRRIQVDVLDVRAHLVQCARGNVQSELLLGFSECDPQPAPCHELGPLGEDPAHFARCVALHERVAIRVGRCSSALI
jgi:hypothetical protein